MADRIQDPLVVMVVTARYGPASRKDPPVRFLPI